MTQEDTDSMDSVWTELAVSLLAPMSRVLTGLAAGLFAASFIEGMQWTRHLAKLAAPLIRRARLGDVPAAAFALAFFSPASANALLGDAHARGELSQRAVILSNLFNSLPSWLTPTPSIFFLTWPVLGFPAVIYTALTLLAAAMRTLLTVGLGRLLLPPLPSEKEKKADPGCTPPGSCSPLSAAFWRKGLDSALKRFRRRLPRLLYMAVPIYVLMFFLQRAGLFEAAEAWLAEHAGFSGVLRPEALGVIVLYMAAELGAAVAAAGSLLHGGGLGTPEVVLALLVGNVLSTPMRGLRHQLPSYAAYYPTALAIKLIVINQGLRALSMIAMTAVYWALAF